MSCRSEEWTASARREGGERQLRVEGRMECTTDGHTLTLEPDNEGVYDDPKVIVLKLTVREPENAIQVITAETVSWSTTIDDEVEVVNVRIPGEDGQQLAITTE